jgi:spore coat protein A, manganese oxidase
VLHFKRRQILKQYLVAMGGYLVLKPGSSRATLGATCPFPVAEGPTLPGASIPKYVSPLLIPPAMPKTARLDRDGKKIDYYEIAARQLSQQVLPPCLPPTTVWGYGSIHHPHSFSYPAFTIEARQRRPVWVRWINDLKDPDTGEFLPPLLPVDPTLHWANPPGGIAGRDTKPRLREPPCPYAGPMPTVTHLHGGLDPQDSDGFPEAWFLPDATNIPRHFATTGTFYDVFRETSPLGDLWRPGSAVFRYPNEQPSATLWYHDHVLGLTRINVYSGLAGFYLLRAGNGDPEEEVERQLPGPAPSRGDRPGKRYFEIPLVIQDRSFNDDGSLFYPDGRALAGEMGPLHTPDSDDPSIWVPEFFGDAMVVNGRTWPHLDVEQRRYRFRLLNACNTRLLILKFENDLPFWMIGTDAGFLPEPVRLPQILLGPAERADTIVDFTEIPVGTEFLLLNIAPDGPDGGVPGDEAPPADPETTGQVMRLRVVRATSTDWSKPPHRLRLPRRAPFCPVTRTRKLSLNEQMSTGEHTGGAPSVLLLLGTVDESGSPVPLHWDDDITENPAPGATEIWELHNFTAEVHPIHPHDAHFEVVNREPLVGGAPRPPASFEAGPKDTVGALPGEITRIRVKFDHPGLFVWHCHILEHEDNEMMRPLHVGPRPPGLPI